MSGLDTTALAALFFGLVAGWMCSHDYHTTYWQSEATKHGAAHYDAKDGSFKWNDEVKP